ncbi:hypothetical protein GIB67_010706 [Kingdonia uniflora]|uniref:Uncharacterized protein n=1 Tax=Kingdonia uniflora TaxID=39325 RepID=A0A7J7L8V8_9MAGN|nr:hypothetical protein GIB67_010706 [Kingdonia uniflora]
MSGRSGQSNENANAQWVEKDVEEIIGIVRTTKPAGQEAQGKRVERSRCRVNTNTHECDYHEWKLSGLPCMHDVSAILPYGWPWVKVERPRKQRIPDPDKEKRQKRCGKCRGYGHNKKTCKGAPTTPKPRVAKTSKMVDTNVHMIRHMSSVGLPPAIPNMRGRGSGCIGGAGGRSSIGAGQT